MREGWITGDNLLFGSWLDGWRRMWSPEMSWIRAWLVSDWLGMALNLFIESFEGLCLGVSWEEIVSRIRVSLYEIQRKAPSTRMKFNDCQSCREQRFSRKARYKVCLDWSGDYWQKAEQVWTCTLLHKSMNAGTCVPWTGQSQLSCRFWYYAGINNHPLNTKWATCHQYRPPQSCRPVDSRTGPMTQ